ncbi:MAG: transglutaminase domain-containing protein [Planctomycetales bacterium]|nr:transglutaminase domain-containing protein [Planctomycetales bacterium]
MFRRFVGGLAALLLSHSIAWAQFQQPTAGDSTSLGELGPVRQFRVGVEITASGGACRGLIATVPVPFDWPEQEVRIAEEDLSPEVAKFKYRMIDGTVKQMLVSIPILPAGHTARALVTFEVRKRPLSPPADTSTLQAPKKLDRDLQKYVGASPYIETRHREIRELAKELAAGHAPDWELVETIYDEVRKRVEYKNGELKGALAALRDGNGDCEELTSLFIALCRVNGIPARTVWVHQHCYPEFYLEDGEGNGAWYPCQAAGTRAFGEMEEQRPIMQKGDNFRTPEQPRDAKRYITEFAKGLPTPGGGRPQIRFVREMVD